MENSILHSFYLSFKIAGLSLVISLLIGIPLGIFLGFRKRWWKELIDLTLTLPMILSPSIVGYYLLVFLGKKGIVGSFLDRYFNYQLAFSTEAAVLCAVIVSLPLMIKTIRTATEQVDRNLIEASYTLGKSPIQTVKKIVLPLIKPGIFYGSILTFARSLGEFGATLMLAGNIPGKTDTIPIKVFALVESGNWDKVHLLVLIYTIFSGVLIYSATMIGKRTHVKY